MIEKETSLNLVGRYPPFLHLLHTADKAIEERESILWIHLGNRGFGLITRRS